MTREGREVKPWKVVSYTSCPECSCSLGVQANGKIVRHSIGFGFVEKVGPGTRHPRFRTTICKGSGMKVKP
jgi:hypothetical protein